MTSIFVKPSVIEQLTSISKNLQDLINYEYDVSTDMTEAIELSKIKDLVDAKLKEKLE